MRVVVPALRLEVHDKGEASSGKSRQLSKTMGKSDMEASSRQLCNRPSKSHMEQHENEIAVIHTAMLSLLFSVVIGVNVSTPLPR